MGLLHGKIFFIFGIDLLTHVVYSRFDLTEPCVDLGALFFLFTQTLPVIANNFLFLLDASEHSLGHDRLVSYLFFFLIDLILQSIDRAYQLGHL